MLETTNVHEILHVRIRGSIVELANQWGTCCPMVCQITVHSSIDKCKQEWSQSIEGTFCCWRNLYFFDFVVYQSRVVHALSEQPSRLVSIHFFVGTGSLWISFVRIMHADRPRSRTNRWTSAVGNQFHLMWNAYSIETNILTIRRRVVYTKLHRGGWLEKKRHVELEHVIPLKRWNGRNVMPGPYDAH